MVKDFVDRIKNSLRKTRAQFVASLSEVLPVGRKITDEVLDEVEEILYSADIGVHATEQLIEELRRSAFEINRGKTDPFSVMKTSVLSLISRVENDKGLLLNKGLKPLVQRTPNEPPLGPNGEPIVQPHGTSNGKRPSVILVVGVNGTGKTTSIGKLAMRFRKEGKSVLLAACDTFRAAAVEQLEVWAHRADAEFLRAQTGADPAAVAFDAVQRAKARSTDVVLIDTAGRLHTSKNLMEELKKVDKVLRKADSLQGSAASDPALFPLTLRQAHSAASHETLLVLDATTGQNALNQAEVFSGSLKITGIILTKLDGTAKGGIVISIIDRLGIPIKLIGVGERIDDLRDFDAVEFVDALFEK